MIDNDRSAVITIGGEEYTLLMDLWECHRQYTGQAKPLREAFVDEVIPAGI